MNIEQKERMKYENEVQKTRELKRIADALESMAMAYLSFKAEKTSTDKLIKMVDDGVFDRGYIIKEDLNNEYDGNGVF